MERTSGVPKTLCEADCIYKGLWGMTTRKPTNEISMGKGAPYKNKGEEGIEFRQKKYKGNESPEK
jgi:hypothetical protein